MNEFGTISRHFKDKDLVNGFYSLLIQVDLYGRSIPLALTELNDKQLFKFRQFYKCTYEELPEQLEEDIDYILNY